MTLCRSRRRQVVEMHCCRLFCWAHNPKVGGSNPPPATKLKLHNINHLKLFAGVLPIHNWLPLRSHQQTATSHAVLLRSTGTAADPHR